MKKILISMALGITLSLGLISCSNNNQINIETNTSNREENLTLSQDAQEILLNYSERGMYLFKANYSSSDALSFALKTIGVNISQLKNKVLKDINGKEIDLSSFKDQNIILEFLRPDCPSCQEFTPMVDATVKDSDVTIIPIFTRGTKEEIENFYKTLNIDIPKNICIDDDKLLVNELNLTQVPTLIFIDKTGHISFVRTELTDSVALKSDIETAFGENKLYEYKADSENVDIQDKENDMLIE